MFWPVPQSHKREVPKRGEQGSFWEDRGDRFHCGVDIYAPKGSEVIALKSGFVRASGIFTKFQNKRLYDATAYILIETTEQVSEKVLYRYSGMAFPPEIYVGDHVKAGQRLGSVEALLSKENADRSVPYFVRDIANSSDPCMLHLEKWYKECLQDRPYFVGNWMGKEMPSCLLNPTETLLECLKH